MIIRYRHFEALYRRAMRAVALGKLDEEELDDRHQGAYRIIGRELLESHLQKVRTAGRYLAAAIFPRFFLAVWPFHPETVLGPRGRAEYFHFRKWMKMKMRE